MRKRAAFTLIELLTVITIIGVLSALLLVALTRGVVMTRRISCVNNVRQIGQAMLQFVSDNHEYPLDTNPDFENGKYQNHLEGFPLSMEREMGKQRTTHDASYISEGVWKCPSMKRPLNFSSNGVYESYGYNNYGMKGLRADTNSLGLGRQFGTSNYSAPPVREGEVVSPSHMIAIGDGFMGTGKTIFGGWSSLMRTPDFTHLPFSQEPYLRHQGKANVIFCDGHVESPTLKELFEDTSDAALIRWNRDNKPHREKL